MILCSAIKISYNSVNVNGVKLPGPQQSIVPCYRHHDGLAFIDRFIRYNLSVELLDCEQGFLTSSKKFLDRKAAYRHALDCGQISASLMQFKDERNQNELYSEDLY